MAYEFNQLQSIKAPQRIWEEITSLLPEMKYQIPNTGRTKKIIYPSFQIYQDQMCYKNVLLSIQMDIKSADNSVIFNTDYLIADKGLGNYVDDEGEIINQSEFINFVINTLASRIKQAFEELCNRTPWSVINKLHSVLSKVAHKLTPVTVRFNKRRYNNTGGYRINDDNNDKDGWASGFSLNYNESNIFCFRKDHKSSLITQDKHHHSESVFQFADSILKSATTMLNPMRNRTSTFSSEQQKEFMDKFRAYIRELGLLSYYYLRMQSEEEYLATNPDAGKYMSNKDWTYMEKKFNHLWKETYNQQLDTIVEIYNSLIAIENLHENH